MSVRQVSVDTQHEFKANNICEEVCFVEISVYYMSDGGGGRPGDFSAPLRIAAIFLSPTTFAAASILATSSSSSGSRIVLANLWWWGTHIITLL